MTTLFMVLFQTSVIKNVTILILQGQLQAQSYWKYMPTNINTLLQVCFVACFR